MDADSKLIASYLVSNGRDGMTAIDFMADLRARVENRIQLSTGGLGAYLESVEGASGSDMDDAMVVKEYCKDLGEYNEQRYSPSVCTEVEKYIIESYPDTSKANTSYVERHNLSMRMGNRRFTRLTNAFSKKVEKYVAMLSLYFIHYNYCRIHKSLRVTPAMQVGLSDSLHDIDWIVGLIDARAPKPNHPETYKR